MSMKRWMISALVLFTVTACAQQDTSIDRRYYGVYNRVSNQMTAASITENDKVLLKATRVGIELLHRCAITQPNTDYGRFVVNAYAKQGAPQAKQKAVASFMAARRLPQETYGLQKDAALCRGTGQLHSVAITAERELREQSELQHTFILGAVVILVDARIKEAKQSR